MLDFFLFEKYSHTPNILFLSRNIVKGLNNSGSGQKRSVGQEI